ncbi:uncharacterized protein LOC116799855 isoform X2 [Chiroxiphia lanceolata]|uniref:uncharacterized protein LOC116799855 isoform X2 n=1 Tax=Chiroxiphia lanceolata TaxID=296741 RepID=UPI0013CEF3BB|nr:uncharacterized protein LOC116799855 isoform X2 [Chiroxiphia lanceolata]
MQAPSPELLLPVALPGRRDRGWGGGAGRVLSSGLTRRLTLGPTTVNLDLKPPPRLRPFQVASQHFESTQQHSFAHEFSNPNFKRPRGGLTPGLSRFPWFYEIPEAPAPSGSSGLGTKAREGSFSLKLQEFQWTLPPGQGCATGSAPACFTPDFEPRWFKTKPLTVVWALGFKFQFPMFIFPQIRAAALFWGWEYPPAVPGALGAGMPHGTGGKAGGDISLLVPRVLGEFLCNLVKPIPRDAGFGWGWEVPGPARCFIGFGGGGERGKMQKTWRKSTKPAPGRDFSTGMGTGRLQCDPKVKLSALTGVVGIQIAAIGSWWKKTLSFRVCKTRSWDFL